MPAASDFENAGDPSRTSTRSRYFHQVNRIDHARAAPGRASVDRLRILQVRNHARRFIEKPSSQMPARVPVA